MFLLVSLFFLNSTADAQFMKKLGKRVEQKVERAVIERVSNEAAKKADRSLDKLFNTKISPFPVSSERVAQEDLPSGYEFEYLYELKMEHKKGDFNIKYYLKENQTYFGAQMPEQAGSNLFMVYDLEKAMTLIYMDNDGQKMVTALHTGSMENTIEDESLNNTFTYEKLPGTKTILGYECNGVRAENDEYIMDFYYATNITGPSFNDVWKMDKNNLPKSFDLSMLEGDPEDTLMMELEMKSKKNKKNNVKMTCVQYEPASLSIATGDYEYPY